MSRPLERDPQPLLVAEVAGLEPARLSTAWEGRNAIWLAGLGWQVTAVDFSDAITKGRERAAREGVEVDFRTLDLLDFEPEAGAYELVLVLYLQIPASERRQVPPAPRRPSPTAGRSSSSATTSST